MVPTASVLASITKPGPWRWRLVKDSGFWQVYENCIYLHVSTFAKGAWEGWLGVWYRRLHAS